jgi:hypothetical protein
MASALNPEDWRYLKVREWLLLLLRFAVTRSEADRSEVLALAQDLDSIGPPQTEAAFGFFLRRSREVCEAILTNGRDSTALRAHAARIDDPRLRRAFAAAVDLQPMRSRPLMTRNDMDLQPAGPVLKRG